MACIQNPSSRGNDASNMEELIGALRDIQSVDFDKLRANLSQSQSEGSSGCRCREYDETKRNCHKIELERNHLETELENILADKAQMANKFERVMEDLKNAEHVSSEQRSENVRLKEQINWMENKLSYVQEQLAKCQHQLQRKEGKLQEQMEASNQTEELICEKKQQISEGEQIIADLSDQNRPSTLRKRYKDVYDKEWPNAFDVLTEKFKNDEKSAIKVLRRILSESYKYALDTSEQQITNAGYCLSGNIQWVSPSCKLLLKEARKHVDIKQAYNLFENFLEANLLKEVQCAYLTESAVRVFAAECFQLCWLMTLQDPPVIFADDPNSGDHFDTNIFNYYTMSGDKIDYVVWPALLCQHNGQLLAKGVALSYQTSRTKSAPTLGRPAANYEESSYVMNQTKNGKNERGSTSGSGEMDAIQEEYQARGDTTSMRHSSNEPMMAQTVLGDGRKCDEYSPVQGHVPVVMHLQQPPPQTNIDWNQFQIFCQHIWLYDERTLRQYYGTNFDHYCTLYHQLYGNHRWN